MFLIDLWVASSRFVLVGMELDLQITWFATFGTIDIAMEGVTELVEHFLERHLLLISLLAWWTVVVLVPSLDASAYDRHHRLLPSSYLPFLLGSIILTRGATAFGSTVQRS